jgi:hypothetical protein
MVMVVVVTLSRQSLQQFIRNIKGWSELFCIVIDSYSSSVLMVISCRHLQNLRSKDDEGVISF